MVVVARNNKDDKLLHRFPVGKQLTMDLFDD